MKLTRLFILVVLLVIVESVAAQDPIKPTGGFKVEDLAWLTGCWEMIDDAKKLRINEQWMAPEGSAMLGMSRTVRNGKMVGYEFLRLESDNVSVKYISRPSQNATDTEFRVSTWSTRYEVVFSNPTHDFPQMISYRLDGDKLHARIEGKMNGKERGVDFPYRRVACR